MVILEEIRSQKRATIETVEARYQETQRELQAFRDEVRSDNRLFHAALRDHSEALRNHGGDVRELRTEVSTLKEQLSRLDAVITTDYRERLHRLEQRVEALERRPA